MMKNVKTSRFDTRLCYVLPFHYYVKMFFFHFLTFHRIEIQWSSNRFDARVGQAHGTFLLVGPLKTSPLDSVTAYI